jgi:hypothetical protein
MRALWEAEPLVLRGGCKGRLVHGEGRMQARPGARSSSSPWSPAYGVPEKRGALKAWTQQGKM